MSHHPVRVDPELTAREARLRYVGDEVQGFRRRRCGRGFTYLDPAGNTVCDPALRAWLASLAIPPAWEEVWISPYRNGHILATGRDDKGRKQYIYHPRWTEQRKLTNFHQLLAFGQALPALRARVDRDLRRPDLGRERVLALVVHLLDSTLIRVGNPEYARSNRSFGLTTLREEHLEVEGNRIHFEFRGKSGKTVALDLRDPRAARAVRRCQELPGQALFQYVDGEGRRHRVDSSDVNEYLSASTGEEFTAKVFRTWGGSSVATSALLALPPAQSKTAAEKNLREAIKLTAQRLRNTPAICRGHYIHPAVGETYLAGRLGELCTGRTCQEGLHEEEQPLMNLLRALDR